MITNEEIERMQIVLQERGNEELFALKELLEVNLDWGLLKIIRDADGSLKVRRRIVQRLLEESEPKWREDLPIQAREYDKAIYLDNQKLINEIRKLQLNWMIVLLGEERVSDK